MGIKAGKHTYGHETMQIFSYGCDYDITVGSFTSIAVSVKVYANQGLGHDHRTGTTCPFSINHKGIFTNCKPITDKSSKPIKIGSDVWIGDGVSINPGITIGDGAVVATNTHVIKDVPDYAIVGGNPMQLIRYRFSDEIIREFQKLRWWTLSDDRINHILPLLQQEPTLEMFDEIYKKLGVIQ